MASDINDSLDFLEARVKEVLPGMTVHKRRRNRLMDGDTLPCVVVSGLGKGRIVSEYMPAGTIWAYDFRVALFQAVADPADADEYLAKNEYAELFARQMYDATKRPNSNCFQVDFDVEDVPNATGPRTRTYDETALVFTFTFDSTRPG